MANLAGAPTRIALKHDFAPSDAGLMRGSRRERNLAPVVADGLRRLALRHSTPVSNVLLALFKLLLHRATRQEDMCLGMIFANRNHPEIEGLNRLFRECPADPHPGHG
ncbi:condensation domain-containing protein (plasmid) [Bradyrhizobium sp. Pa8]|uniref:condensation domain-containing protein n=1 Tax=Bradyrhizobium sp. Pa8 TaxID=3386552 RepID=UPI00403F2267